MSLLGKTFTRVTKLHMNESKYPPAVGNVCLIECVTDIHGVSQKALVQRKRRVRAVKKDDAKKPRKTRKPEPAINADVSTLLIPIREI